jgi:hypothetical protein
MNCEMKNLNIDIPASTYEALIRMMKARHSTVLPNTAAAMIERGITETLAAHPNLRNAYDAANILCTSQHGCSCTPARMKSCGRWSGIAP